MQRVICNGVITDILPLDLNLTYPDKGALVTHGAVYFSLVNKASGSSYSNPIYGND
jgi:hypothetical protein